MPSSPLASRPTKTAVDRLYKGTASDGDECLTNETNGTINLNRSQRETTAPNKGSGAMESQVGRGRMTYGD